MRLMTRRSSPNPWRADGIGRAMRSSFDDPSAGEDVEALGLVGPFDNLDRPGSRSGKRFPEFVTGIASIGENMTHPGETTAHGFEDIDGAVTILDIGRVHEGHDQLRTHLADFMAAYNFARRLKTLSGLTPYEYIAKIWTSEPDRFIGNPIHQMPGLNRSSMWVRKVTG